MVMLGRKHIPVYKGFADGDTQIIRERVLAVSLLFDIVDIYSFCDIPIHRESSYVGSCLNRGKEKSW
jgi:hypothetical protein